LAWVTVLEHPLSLVELSEALNPKFSFLNLRHTIDRLCGDFVAVDESGKVYFAHHTAKEYILNSAGNTLAVDLEAAHKLVFDKCISILTDHRFRMRLKKEGCTGLIRYCCLFWWHHMAQGYVGVLDQRYEHQLAAFFKSTACLAWIEAVARTGQLRVLTSTSETLGYLERERWTGKDESPVSETLLDVELLRNWTVELVRIVGKFGTHLVQYPSCINTLVPLFSPAESMIGKHFLSTHPAAPRITGISSRRWDDCLTRFVLDEVPQGIQCLDDYFGIRTSKKCVNLYSTTTFQEAQKFTHDEKISVSVFSQDGDFLMTCGVKTIKVWMVATGKVISVFSNPRGIEARGASFTRDCSTITVCTSSWILCHQLVSELEDWQYVDWKLLEAPVRGQHKPTCVSFSPNGSKLAVCSRGTPASVWGTECGNYVGSANVGNNREDWRFANITHVAWNPVSEHIVGIDDTSSIFKWNPLDVEIELEVKTQAHLIACSPDGRLVAVSATDAAFKIFSFDNFSLLYIMPPSNHFSRFSFSSNGRRIYGANPSSCNVWEPKALIRMARTDEKGGDAASSDYDMSTTTVSGTPTGVWKEVTILCVDPTSTAFAFGSRGGEVTLAQPSLGQDEEDGGLDLVKTKFGSCPISHLEISRGGNLIAIASRGNYIKVGKRVSGVAHRPWQETLFETKAKSQVRQLLFDSDAE
ncbi:WD40 repeat domain-containing protein, partial [Candidatus Bathyarchaeota archaeon]|nr:WD40 repeat domain-containing protein [Candidatus Bathyarchaeota archaeon]